jgi:hypothetical protein
VATGVVSLARTDDSPESPGASRPYLGDRILDEDSSARIDAESLGPLKVDVENSFARKMVALTGSAADARIEQLGDPRRLQ